MLKLLGIFALWTFDILFGIDLWGVLTVQKFEPEIDSWSHIDWHQTKFGFMQKWVIQNGVLESELHYWKRETLTDKHISTSYYT